MSPATLLMAMIIAAGAFLWSASALEERRYAGAEADGIQTAETIAATVVGSRLHDALESGSRLAAEDFADMRADVVELRRDGQLLALGTWRLDGSELFVYGSASAGLTAPSTADLARAKAGKTWAVHGRDEDGADILHVALPAVTQEGGAETDRLVQVALPYDQLLQGVEERVVREEVFLAVLLALPITALALMQRRMRKRQGERRTDPLTGLGNRRALQVEAGDLVAKAAAERPTALLLIDLTNFRYVNNTLGHGAGDQLLCQVAATLRSTVRATDLLVRLGGDEFAVVVRDLGGAADARRRAEELLQELRRASYVVDGVDLMIDASIGLALAPEHGTTLADLLQHADVAMYEAKRQDVGTRVYDPGTDTHTVGQLEMVSELRRALANEEFLLYYQPKVSLADGSVTSAEALLRWQHPTRGLLPPGVFLPVLESSGLMQPVTRWVLREAVRQAASWRKAGMPLPVAVNLTPRSLLEEDLPARVLATLAGAELPASFLELEITETAVMTDPERAGVVVAQLRARGVRVAIDDFGAGYTSLAHLRSLPIATLKLDRSLISHMLERAEDDAVAEALINLAHRLGLSVVAEGIETEDVWQRLAELGCDEAQGYLMSPPLHPAALEGWVAEHRGVGMFAAAGEHAVTG
jgi:diguanylate cyclase (GGDEF)-like protein